ncbi:hypothetical protein F3Y22_tig00112249pilonHSYRG00207 [Hibiscus syriacus]|uniref:RNase H type-1 domain-containing protein n=1 Tax=Hibiscus syriacus TaxID=106335 RepID=A0A6A2X3J5_HIBSY|nr:hypothetical protein F3Y22_tig00112249pilonHSYRG00207 [Hibiscus syriacus]
MRLVHSIFGSQFFFNGDLRLWILTNLYEVNLANAGGISWSSLFAAAIWQIWKQRNECIFHGTPHSSGTTLHRSISWAKYYDNFAAGIARRQKPIVEDKGRTKPPSGWYCLNTDASVTTVNGAGKIGGVIRNHDGGWEIGFSKNIGSSTVLQAELWGIYEGLLLAKSIALVIEVNPRRNQLSLVRAIAKLCFSNWEVSFEWIPRSRNKVADKIAKLAPVEHFDLIQYALPPMEVADIVTLEANAATHDSGCWFWFVVPAPEASVVSGSPP